MKTSVAAQNQAKSRRTLYPVYDKDTHRKEKVFFGAQLRYEFWDLNQEYA